jgi:hypothetical protein
MTHLRFLAPSAILAAAIAVGPAAAATALDASMALTATSQIGSPVQAEKSDPQSTKWNNPLEQLTVTSSATAQLGNNTVTTHGTETATWLTANKGSVVANMGHEFQVPDAVEGHQIDTLLNGGVDWTYQFRAEGDGVFNLDFKVVGNDANTFGLGAWAFVISGGTFDSINISGTLGGLRDNEHSGSVSETLKAGQTYRVSLINQNGLGSFAPNDQSSSADSTFDWTISDAPVAGAVPEPSTWALAIMGFGLMGVALRRRGMIPSA